ncbi:MFS transporter [Diaminobutyricibacter tongyongensis]|uniref:MFS transporter n=1 Tax=Leifsonia tongyongensis TaxID=1268043 RepID=UPI001F04FAD3|nr:MFS transporter [Diaminobutyricibacter tongyongensis]
MIDNEVITRPSSRVRLAPETRRGLIALGLGGTLEWYDWMLFGLVASYLGPKFFPASSPVAATLSALAVFAVGFFFRPIGGIILGTFADRIGRRKIMIFSVGMMAITTLVIAICPTYAQIGAWAGVILLLTRIVQGISTGVEGPLATAQGLELVPEGREGTVAGVMSAFVNFGILAASLVTFLTVLVLGPTAMSDWGWRIPFGVAVVGSLIVVYLRRRLPETMTQEELEESSTGAIWSSVGRNWLSVLAIVFVVGAVQVYNYAWTTGLPNTARTVMNESPAAVFGITTLLSVVMVVGSLIVGKLVDGKALSKWYIWTRALAIPSMFLILLYVRPGIGAFAGVVLGGSIVMVLNMTLYNVVTSTLMPKASRGAGTALGYGIGVAVFGGTAAYLVVWCASIHQLWLFSMYGAVLMVLSIVLYVLARRINGIHIGR